MKTCTKCNISKDDNQFYKRNWCKECIKSYNKAYRLANLEKFKQYKQTDEYKLKSKEYKLKTKNHIKQWGKEYYINNKNKFNNYYNLNKDKIKKYSVEYNNKNKIKTNAKLRARYAANPEIKLRRLISGRVCEWLKKMGTSKNNNSISKYLDFTIKELKIHLEKQFDPWMTWTNHGVYNSKLWDDNDQLTWTWQIDHIIPQCDLPYTSMSDENFKKCWSLDNLRPLSAKENITLGARITKRTYS